MRKHLASRSFVAGLIAVLTLPALGQPEKSDPWAGIDVLYPADATPGGAACGQQSGCYKKRAGLAKCHRCCARACGGSNNCHRGCYPAHLPRSKWPE